MNSNKPNLIAEIPGPKGKAYLEKNDRVVSPSLPHAYPLVIKKAQGCLVEDLDGNTYLDFAAGIAVCSTGHCHPAVVKAIQDQAEKLIHICGADFYDPNYINLSERIGSLAPGSEPKQVFLGNSGAEAVEAAIKLSRNHTKRPNIIAFFGAFHGRTMGAVSLTASKPVYHKGFGPLLPAVTHVPYAYCYRCEFNQSYPDCNLACIDYIENKVLGQNLPAEEVAAIFVEPVQGEGGYIVPPDGWHQRLRELCDQHGILFVDDEVQAGIGRTGKMFAIEHWDVVPDIITSAKALGSGMPISAMIAKEDIMTWDPGAHGSTYGGNPVASAAAQATLDVIEQENLMENAASVGAVMKENLEDIATNSKMIGDVRGLGLMIGVELVKDKTTKEKAKHETEEVMMACFERGLMVLPCGPNSIRFSPPLNITQQDADTALNIFTEALADVEKKL